MAEKITKTAFGDVGMSYVPKATNPDKGAPTIQGFNTNEVQNFANAYTKAMGQNTVNVTKPISASNLNTPLVNPPPKPVGDNINISGMNSTIAGIDGSIQGAQNKVAQETKADDATTLFKNYISASENIEKPSGTKLYQDLYNQNNIQGLGQQSIADQQEYDVLKAELQGITDRATQAQLSIEGQGRGIPLGIIGGQQARIAKEAAISALPVQSKVLLAQAKLTGSQNALKLAQDNLNTLFSIKSKDAENEYNYKTNLLDKYYDFATSEQKRKLDEKKAEETLAYNEKKDLLDYKKSFIPELIKAGQANLIDDLNGAETVEEVNGVAGKIRVGGSTEAPKVVSINGVDSIWDGAKYVPATVAGGGNELILAGAQESIKNASSLLDNKYLSTAVGPNPLARISFSNVVTGGKDDFIAKVGKLTKNLSLDTLIQAKAKGATFGALSDTEMKILAGAATTINDKAVTNKKGEIVGYKGSEKAFRDEIQLITNFAKLDYLLKGGNLEDVGAFTTEDGSVMVENSDGTITKLR